MPLSWHDHDYVDGRAWVESMPWTQPPQYRGPQYWVGWIDFQPQWEVHMSWMDVSLYGLWHDWQLQCEQQALDMTARRVMLQQMLGRSNMSAMVATHGLEQLVDRMIMTTTQIGGTHGVVSGVNTITTSQREQAARKMERTMRRQRKDPLEIDWERRKIMSGSMDAEISKQLHEKQIQGSIAAAELDRAGPSSLLPPSGHQSPYRQFGQQSSQALMMSSTQALPQQQQPQGMGSQPQPAVQSAHPQQATQYMQQGNMQYTAGPTAPSLQSPQQAPQPPMLLAPMALGLQHQMQYLPQQQMQQSSTTMTTTTTTSTSTSSDPMMHPIGMSQQAAPQLGAGSMQMLPGQQFPQQMMASQQGIGAGQQISQQALPPVPQQAQITYPQQGLDQQMQMMSIVDQVPKDKKKKLKSESSSKHKSKSNSKFDPSMYRRVDAPSMPPVPGSSMVPVSMIDQAQILELDKKGKSKSKDKRKKSFLFG